MWIQVGLFIGGLTALYFGAEWLVRGSARLARSFGISAVVVGLTVVAFGTSAPEAVVSTLAALSGQGDIALGNVVGSNMINIGVILGVSAGIYPLFVDTRLLRREVPFMVAVSLLVLILALDGTLSRLNGLMLLAAFAGYLVFVLAEARAEPEELEKHYRELGEEERLEPQGRKRAVDVGLIALGLVMLVVGAQALLQSAIFFARALGVSEIVIGVTIVAIGTSLPELATSLVAALRRESAIALGNVVGSNIFNALFILGIASTAHPLRVHAQLIRFDLPVMIGFAFVLLPLALLGSRLKIGRIEGAILVATYAGYAWFVVHGVDRFLG